MNTLTDMAETCTKFFSMKQQFHQFIIFSLNITAYCNVKLLYFPKMPKIYKLMDAWVVKIPKFNVLPSYLSPMPVSPVLNQRCIWGVGLQPKTFLLVANVLKYRNIINQCLQCTEHNLAQLCRLHPLHPLS